MFFLLSMNAFNDLNKSKFNLPLIFFCNALLQHKKEAIFAEAYADFLLKLLGVVGEGSKFKFFFNSPTKYCPRKFF